jgi:hypothetical protein
MFFKVKILLFLCCCFFLCVDYLFIYYSVSLFRSHCSFLYVFLISLFSCVCLIVCLLPAFFPLSSLFPPFVFYSFIPARVCIGIDIVARAVVCISGRDEPG